jgi:hypothetical protein
VVAQGVPDECFTLQVTGGDRYRSTATSTGGHWPRVFPVIRSATDNSIIWESDPKSPHLIERGARAVDFKVVMSSDLKCTCYNLSNTVLETAIGNTSFDPNSTDNNYRNGHTHINLQNRWNFWPINEP